MEFFTENGKQYTDSVLTKMIEVRPCWDAEYYTADSYVFGEGLYSMIEYYKGDGKITDAQVPAIEKSFDASLLEEALGIDMQEMSF